MTEIVPINVQTSLGVCNSLSNILKKSFGPNALQVLYTTSTGKVLLTSDGSTILSALHVSHPIGRWIIDRVLKFHSLHGDHAKTFVLVLTEILDGMSRELGNMDKGINRNFESSDERTRDSIIRLGISFSSIARGTFPHKVLPAVIEKCIKISSTNWEAMNSAIPNIIHTYLSGSLNPKQCKFVSGLVWDFIKGFGGDNDLTILRDIVSDLLDTFGIISTEIGGLPIESSFMLDGFVLSRDVSNISLQGSPECASRFVILGFDPSRNAPESGATIVVKTVDNLLHNMQHSRSQVAIFVKLLVKCDITLVLCSECLPAIILSHLQRASVAVVHAVPLEELQRLGTITGTDILYDCPMALGSSAIGSVKEVKRVVLGRQRYTHLVPEDQVRSKHLVLCAPSEGMCRVVSQAVINTIRCLKVGFESSNFIGNPLTSEPPTLNTTHGDSNGCGLREQHLYLISGGGAAELIASDLLHHEHLASKDDHYQSTALKILSQALLCVPRTLFQNSFVATAKERHSFVTIVDDIWRIYQSKSNVALGIDGKRGSPCCLSHVGVIEPMASRFILWCSVIEAVIELLKMDMIIPVSKIVMKPEGSDDSDDD